MRAGDDDATPRRLRTYLVELYVPGATPLSEITASVRAAALAVSSNGASVRYVRSILVPGDELCFCLYRAEDADTVADAIRRAGLTFERIVPSEEDA